MLKLHFCYHKTLRHLKKQSFYHCCKCCLCKAYSPDIFQAHLVYTGLAVTMDIEIIITFPLLIFDHAYDNSVLQQRDGYMVLSIMIKLACLI